MEVLDATASKALTIGKCERVHIRTETKHEDRESVLIGHITARTYAEDCACLKPAPKISLKHCETFLGEAINDLCAKYGHAQPYR